MSGIFGALNLADTDRVFAATTGQQVIYQAATEWVAQQNASLNAVMSTFVDETTSDYTRRYKLPGGGRLQRMGPNAQPGAVKAYGGWDVSFPLEDFGAQIAGDRVTLGYMTVAELSRHIETVWAQNVSTVRFEILAAMFRSSNGTFVDPLWGSLTVRRLANNDGTVYPPVLGSEAEAQDTHHLESSYASSAISDTNDPIVTMVDELEEHFGANTGGSEIVVFCNNAQRAKLQDLTDFETVIDRFIQPGTQTAIPSIPGMTLPGRTLGRHGAGAWIQEWRWIPANYLLAVHLGAPRPLIKRVDPADTGLPQDLALVAEDAEHPFESSFWSHRFGVGVGNHLNGVVMELGTGGTYTVPAAYA